MAKQKHTRALFEVIQKDKRISRNGGALPTPSWWKKGAAASAQIPPLPRPTLVHRIFPTKAPQAAKPVFAPPAPVATPAVPEAPPAEPKAPSQVWAFLTPASAAIIGATLLVAVLVGWIAVRYSRHASQAQLALTGPPHPEVMELSYTKPTPAPAAPMAEPTAAPAAAVQTPARQTGAMYAILHCYVTQKSAQQAAAFLNAHNIPCTIERNVPGVLPQWYAVVGLNSFARSAAPDYAEYVQQIRKLIQTQGSGVPLSVHSFRPQLVPWNPPEAAQAG